MSTMFDCNVVYVDPEIASGGDGATPSTAVSALPNILSLAANTVYLIARRDTTINYVAGANVQANVYLIGMPDPEDWLYHWVPAEAKAAWDGNMEAEYAALRPTAINAVTTFKNDAGEVGLHRISFNQMPISTSAAPNGGVFLEIGSTTADPAQNMGKSGFVTNCEFVLPDSDISDPAVTALAVVPNFNSWFRASGFANLRMENLRIVNPGRMAGWAFGTGASYGNTGPFIIQSTFRAIVRNIEAWTGTDYTYNRASGLGLNNGRQLFFISNVSDFEFSNVTHHGVVQHTSGEAYVHGLLFMTGTNHVRRLSRIKSRIDRMFDPAMLPASLTLSTPIIECACTGGHFAVAQRDERMAIYDEDIDIDTAPCWGGVPGNTSLVFNPATVPYTGQPVVKLRGPSVAGTSYVGDYMLHNFDGYCKNIRVVVPDSGGIGVPNIPYALDLSFPISHCRGGSIRDLEIRNRRAGGLFIEGNSFTPAGKTVGDLPCPPIKLGDMEGVLWARKVGYLEIDYLGVDRSHHWMAYEGSSIYIHEVELDKLGWTEVDQPFPRCFTGRVVIDKINIPIKLPITGMTNYGRTGLIINSENDFEGKSKFTNGLYHGENYNVYREGGAVSSIRLYGRTDTRVPLQVGFDMFKNIEVEATAPGKYLAEVHMIHTGYAEAQKPKLPRRFVVRMKVWRKEKYPDGSGEVLKYREVNSQTDGWWERVPVDIDVWKNIEIYFAFKAVIPIELFAPTAEAPDSLVVKTRIEFDFYDPDAGFCYFDPKVELHEVL